MKMQRAAIIDLTANIAAPLAIFYGLHAAGVAQVPALLLGAVPPTLRALQTVISRRRVDTLALLTLSFIAVGTGVSFMTGSPRFLLAKDGWMTGAIGLWMLGTLLRTPFFFQIIRTYLTEPARGKAEIMWRDSASYRHLLRVITAMWGIGLLLDAGVRVVLAYTLPVDRVPLISGLQYVVVYCCLEGATRVYGRRGSVRARVVAESGQEFS